MTGAPFYKWAGGKRRQVDTLLPLLGDLGALRHYEERFLGAGAVFLALRAQGYRGTARLNDLEPVVAATWRAVQVDPRGVIEVFRDHAALDCKDHYYEVRSQRPFADIEVAGWFLYLNKAGWNGLWRVNARGVNNVPFGDGRPVSIDEEALMFAHGALRDTTITCGDFAVGDPLDGSAVYLDPPFLPLTKTASFTAYTRKGFSPSDQLRLATWCRTQGLAGNRVVLSNAGHPDSLTAFQRDADEVHTVRAPRAISCKGNDRRAVAEYVFVFGPAEVVTEGVTEGVTEVAAQDPVEGPAKDLSAPQAFKPWP